MSRDIEFIARFPKMKEIIEAPMSEEDRMLLEAQRVINGESIDNKSGMVEYEMTFEYAPIVINIDDVVRYFEYDKKHTTLKMFDGDAYIVKYKYRLFKLLKEQLTGSFVLVAADLRFEEKLAAKAQEIQEILKTVPYSSNGTGSQPITDTFTTSCSDTKPEE